jgi:hypothetical protein
MVAGNYSLLYIFGMYGNFIVSSRRVDLREDGTTEKLVGVVMCITDGVGVGDGSGV